MASKDFIVKNGLRIGGSSGTGSLTAGDASFLTSLSAASLSGAAGAGVTTGATIALGGDLGGSVALDTLNGTKTLTATIQANSVALGTDTTGDYVESFAVNTTFESLTGTIGTGEGATVTGLGLKSSGVTPGTYGSQTAIPALTVDETGRITSAGTNTIATTLTANDGTTDIGIDLLSEKLTLAGTANEIETSASGNTITVGLPNDVTIAGNLTVNGTCTLLNQAVTATTTATENNFVIRSTDTGADASPDLKLWRDSSDPDNNDYIGNIFFTGTNSAAEATDYAHILGQITDVTNNSEDARLTFKTMAGGTLADRLTINSGKVGIGITTPTELLQVFSSSDPTILIGGGPSDGTTGGTATLQWHANNGTVGNAFTATYYKDATNDRLTFMDGGFVNVLTLDNGGNVGIGTTNPDSIFHVYSSASAMLKMQSVSGNNDIGLDFFRGDDRKWQIRNNGNDDSFYIIPQGENDTDTKFAITSSGLVGIGTTNPNEELTVVGTLSASTSMVSPIANGTTCVDGPLVCGTTKVCSPIIAGSTCVDSALICGTTASFAGGYGSTGITIATDGDICSSGKISIGTTAQNADLTIAGTLSASGIIYADAFNSLTGGDTIDFNDNIDLAGTLTLSSGLNAGTTNSVIIEDSGVIKKRTIDSRVWGTTLIDNGGSTGTANRIAKFSDGDTIADSTISDDGSDIILGTTNTTVKVDDDATAGSIQFNGNKSAFHTTTCTINNAASGVLVSIPVANYRTGKIIISAKGASACTSHVETTEILMIHDGTNAYTTEYATIRSGDAVGEYIGVKVGTNIELRACNDLGGSATATFVTAIQHLTV